MSKPRADHPWRRGGGKRVKIQQKKKLKAAPPPEQLRLPDVGICPRCLRLTSVAEWAEGTCCRLGAP